MTGFPAAFSRTTPVIVPGADSATLTVRVWPPASVTLRVTVAYPALPNSTWCSPADRLLRVYRPLAAVVVEGTPGRVTVAPATGCAVAASVTVPVIVAGWVFALVSSRTCFATDGTPALFLMTRR